MSAPAVAGPCPECGVDNAPDHNYCKHCGTPLRAIDVERDLSAGLAERTRDRCLAVLKSDPENPTLHHNLGLAYYHLGLASYHLGVIRERQNDIEAAVRCFERVVAANPSDASAHYHLGVNYRRQGLEVLAMSSLAEALKLDPSDTAAAEELQSLQR